MTVVELTQERLTQLVAGFQRARIAVVGDFFLDKYLDCDAEIEQRSVETGRPAHQVVAIRTSPGCAGTVVGNLASLEAGRLYAIGITGDDGEGFDLRNRLAELGCDTTHLHAVAGCMTPTYLKPRNKRDASLAGEHDRYDTRNRTETDAETEQRIIRSIDAVLPQVDAVMIMDQIEERGRGVVTEVVRQALVERAKQRPDVIFFADSRRRIRDYRHIVIKPNEFEALGRDMWLPEETVDLVVLRPAVEALRKEVEAPVVVTRGSLGAIVTDPKWTIVPGVGLDGPIDQTGAGDSATAGAVLALCAGAELPEAALIGNLVASITIKQINTTGTARTSQLASQLAVWRQQQKEGQHA